MSASVHYSTCPKCAHVRRPDETEALDRCPACGLYFSKWAAREQFASQSSLVQEPEEASGWCERLQRAPENVDATRIYASAILLVMLAVWGVRLYRMDYRDGEIMFSFMHNILLPIHEAGHVLFMPFGEFMTILGGSLFQLLLPLICAGAFLWKNTDAFGAGVGVWWAGASLLDLAPYIYDAKEPQLILLGDRTGEDGPHDWIYLLDIFGAVRHSHSYGALTHTLGLFVMVAGLFWSAHTVWRWRRCHEQLGY